MSYKKFFKPVNSVLPVSHRSNEGTGSSSTVGKHSNWLPEVYSGPPDRVQRYQVYEQMNLDHEISAALDTIADFGTEPDDLTDLPFIIKFNDEPTPSEISVIEKSLGQWTRLNELNKRTWKIFRSTLQYGDQFFIRDPETFKLFWIDPSKVEKVMVNESEGKKIESYFVKDIDLNVKDLVATNQLNKLSAQQYGTNSIMFSPPLTSGLGSGYAGLGQGSGSAHNNSGSTVVDAQHIVQVTLTDGMNAAWPFGLSILETIYKVYKQKEMLEDAILIYRIHRAPERRVFFIDVGTMPPNKASQYLERIKYEVQQKRIPSRSGGGGNLTDSTYNPMCLALDTRIPLLDGRTLPLSDLISEYENGKENWVFSCDPETGKIVPGVVSCAAVTRKNAEVIKVTLDNGEEIICTPDHKIPVLGKGFVEAQYLTTTDSLISYETRLQSLSKDKDRSYHQVFDHETNKWVFSHRMAAEFLKGSDKQNDMIFNVENTELDRSIIHHADYNRYNNSPDNLIWMSNKDHFEYHSATKQEYWDSLSDEEFIRVTDKIRSSLEEYRSNNPNWKDCLRNRDNTWISNMKKNDPKKFKKWRKKLGKSLSKFYKQNTPRVKQLKAMYSASMKKNKAVNQYLIFTQEMHDRLVQIVLQNDSNRLETIVLVNSDEIFMKLLKDANPVLKNSTENVNADLFTNSKLERMYLKFGYTNWKHFKEVTTGSTKDLRAIVYTHTLMSRFIQLVNPFMSDKFALKSCVALINKDAEFLGILKNTNPRASNRIDFSEVDEVNIVNMIKSFGYKSWSDFKEKKDLFNHKIVSIEWLTDRIDVGTITVDKEEKYHNYHTFALESGIFVKNSTLEDYYFSVTSEGRGSKVEVLPGGENLGDIDDLRYFNNKMMRALGVPSSYLPTGPEDGTATVNDGRVGTAFIQEFRFAKVVRRYQQQIEKIFDKEFKLFLKHRGVTIDSSLFQITLTEPQSFSEYRRLELDAAKINTFTALTDIPFVSKRFILKRYLGWTEEELAENERMWKEERSRLSKKFNSDGSVGAPSGGASAPAQLSDVGITSSGIDGMAPEDDAAETDDLDTDNSEADVDSNEVDNFGEQ